MKQLRIGDITIDAVIEREGPWRRPQDFFPAYDEAVFRHHLAGMEPEVFDAALGLMVITYQTFVVRTPRRYRAASRSSTRSNASNRRSVARPWRSTSCRRHARARTSSA